MSSDHGSRLRDLIERWQDLVTRYGAASRVANHDGNVELDAFRDGKASGMADCIHELDALLRASASAPPEKEKTVVPTPLEHKSGCRSLYENILGGLHKCNCGASSALSPEPQSHTGFTVGYCTKCREWKSQPIGCPCHDCATQLVQWDGDAALSPDPSALQEAANPPATQDETCLVEELARIAADWKSEIAEFATKDDPYYNGVRQCLQDIESSAALASPRETEPCVRSECRDDYIGVTDQQKPRG